MIRTDDDADGIMTLSVQRLLAGCIGASHEQTDVGVSLGQAPPLLRRQPEEADRRYRVGHQKLGGDCENFLQQRTANSCFQQCGSGDRLQLKALMTAAT